MDAELQQSLASLIDKAVSGAEGMVNFSEAHIPDVIEQLLLWKTVESLTFFVLSVVIFFLSVAVCLKTMKGLRNSESWTKDEFRGAGHSGAFIISTVVSVCGLFMSPLGVFNNLIWLKITLAPKLYLLEYATELVK